NQPDTNEPITPTSNPLQAAIAGHLQHVEAAAAPGRESQPQRYPDLTRRLREFFADSGRLRPPCPAGLERRSSSGRPPASASGQSPSAVLHWAAWNRNRSASKPSPSTTSPAPGEPSCRTSARSSGRSFTSARSTALIAASPPPPS